MRLAIVQYSECLTALLRTKGRLVILNAVEESATRVVIPTFSAIYSSAAINWTLKTLAYPPILTAFRNDKPTLALLCHRA